jgi:hypothetical protein
MCEIYTERGNISPKISAEKNSKIPYTRMFIHVTDDSSNNYLTLAKAFRDNLNNVAEYKLRLTSVSKDTDYNTY